MSADSFHPSSPIAGDAFLTALVARWREMRESPAVSPAGIGFRPAREAADIRRMCVAAASAMEADAIARIWRAVCGDVAASRGLETVYVAGGDAMQGIEAARGFFGFAPNLVSLPSVRDALDRAVSATGVLACVPWPEHAGAGQWWPMLNESKYHSLCIVGGWPCLPGSPTETPRIAIVGRLSMEDSGDDEVLATAHDDHWSADRRLQDVGLKAEVVARARSLALIRIPEFVAVDDRRIELARKAGLDGLRVVGVRPRP